MSGANCCMIGNFHSPFVARCPVNTGSSVRVMQTAFSLHIVIFFLSRIEIILLSASMDNDNKFCATGILCAILALVGRSGRRSSPLALACIMFLVAEMTLGPLGIITLLWRYTLWGKIVTQNKTSQHRMQMSQGERFTPSNSNA